MYSKFSTRNFFISYGYGFNNCGGTSPVTISLNFMEGCLPEEVGYATYKFSATGAEVKKYSDSACNTAPLESINYTYDQLEFNQCHPNDGDNPDEDRKSSREVTTFLLAPTRAPTPAPTYKKGAPTPRPTASPTLQKFPYLLTENFASTDCTGPAKDIYIDVSAVCDVSFSYQLAPTAENPNNYAKTLNPGSFKISAEGGHRYRESFSDDKCLTPTAPKRIEGTLGLCMTATSSDPSNPTRSSTKYSGITNLNDLYQKYPGYLVYSDYLGNDCTGGLTSLFFQGNITTIITITSTHTITTNHYKIHPRHVTLTLLLLVLPTLKVHVMQLHYTLKLTLMLPVLLKWQSTHTHQLAVISQKRKSLVLLNLQKLHAV